MSCSQSTTSDCIPYPFSCKWIYQASGISVKTILRTGPEISTFRAIQTQRKNTALNQMTTVPVAMEITTDPVFEGPQSEDDLEFTESNTTPPTSAAEVKQLPPYRRTDPAGKVTGGGAQCYPHHEAGQDYFGQAVNQVSE